MWPKAFAQLLELLPHVSRVLPIADRFFQSKTANDEATRHSLDSLHHSVAEMGAGHAGIYRQLNDLADKAADAATEAREARVAADAAQQHLARIEQRLDRIAMLLMVLTFAVVMGFVVLTVYVLHRPN